MQPRNTRLQPPGFLFLFFYKYYLIYSLHFSLYPTRFFYDFHTHVALAGWRWTPSSSSSSFLTCLAFLYFFYHSGLTCFFPATDNKPSATTFKLEQQFLFKGSKGGFEKTVGYSHFVCCNNIITIRHATVTPKILELTKKIDCWGGIAMMMTIFSHQVRFINKRGNLFRIKTKRRKFCVPTPATR